MHSSLIWNPFCLYICVAYGFWDTEEFNKNCFWLLELDLIQVIKISFYSYFSMFFFPWYWGIRYISNWHLTCWLRKPTPTKVSWESKILANTQATSKIKQQMESL